MKKQHVLLIDDNEVDNYISKYIFTKSQMAEKITIKSSAIEALKLLEELKGNSAEFPDLIFLDIRMPLMDGFQFLDEFMKFDEALKNHCSVIMLTSSSDQEDIKKALQYTVVKKYLTKPLTLKMLENL